jgi:hypothetical protein
MRIRLVATVLVVIAACAVVPRAQEQPAMSLELLLGRAAWYVDEFIEKFSNVVAEEHYLQESSVPLPTGIVATGRGGTVVAQSASFNGARRREIRSDFLLVSLQGSFDWVPFRDVFEVDSLPVRDREQRLTKLFLEPSAGALEQADRIREESARYNLGTMRRTINNPILGLAVLQADFQQRFHFTLVKADPTMGPDVYEVEYREEMKPTMIRGRADLDLFSHGHLWIEGETGRLLKNDVSLEQPSLRGQVTTTFRQDDRFGIAVPAEMQELYTTDTGARVMATATYERFRRFDVQTTQDIVKQ